MNKYNVHAYKVIGVKVEGVIAETPEEAAKWVDNKMILRGPGATSNMGVPAPAHVSNEEMADDRALYYLVDRQEDEEYHHSRWLWKDCKTSLRVSGADEDRLLLLAHRLGPKVINDILRVNRDQLPLLMGLDKDLDCRIEDILKGS